MEKFKTVLDLHFKHLNPAGYYLVTLLTAGTERIFSTTVFQCPCNATWNLPYGLVFLLVPALGLFLLGYTLNARTWRLLTSCCVSCTCTCGGALRGLQVFAQLSGTAALAPLTWVAVALLGGDFYQCAVSGSKVMARHLCSGRAPNCTNLLPLLPCRNKQADEFKDLLNVLKAQSQVWGWILIAAVIVGLLIFVSFARCISPVTFMQLKFWNLYLKEEQKVFKSQATGHATQLAENNVKCFFEGSQSQEFETPSMKDWEAISSLYTFNPNYQYYSVLHKYVNRGDKTSSIKSSEGDAMPPVLGFVDVHTTADL